MIGLNLILLFFILLITMNEWYLFYEYVLLATLIIDITFIEIFIKSKLYRTKKMICKFIIIIILPLFIHTIFIKFVCSYDVYEYHDTTYINKIYSINQKNDNNYNVHFKFYTSMNYVIESREGEVVLVEGEENSRIERTILKKELRLFNKTILTLNHNMFGEEINYFYINIKDIK